jgi:hypothetical protein
VEKDSAFLSIPQNPLNPACPVKYEIHLTGVDPACPVKSNKPNKI